MEIVFKCPSCKGNASVKMTEEEAEEIKQRILDDGRSPTLVIHCENNHELIVTLYNLRTGEGLGVRDIVVAHGSKEEKTDEVDWLSKAFGGES